MSHLRRLTSEQFKESSAAKSGDALLVKAYATSIEPGPQARAVQFTISTGDVDRDGDTIAPGGWELDNFKAGGAVLWAHDASQLPVAKPTDVWVENGRLKSICVFPTKDEYDFADTVYRMIQGGYLKATSVGFKPLAWAEADRQGLKMPIDFTRQELMEYSIVPVPANPKALLEAKSAGIELAPYAEWLERSLDAFTKGGHSLSREVLESAWQIVRPVKIIEVPVTDIKSGKVLSAASAAKLKEVASHHAAAMDSHSKAMKCMKDFMQACGYKDEDGDSDGGGDMAAAAAPAETKDAPPASAAPVAAPQSDAAPAAPIETQKATSPDSPAPELFEVNAKDIAKLVAMSLETALKGI